MLAVIRPGNKAKTGCIVALATELRELTFTAGIRTLPTRFIEVAVFYATGPMFSFARVAQRA
jgi:hypothetical protein